MTTTGQVGAGRLDVVEEITIAASRQKVFDGLCAMGSWWPHRFVDGSLVHLEAVVGGRFWEEWSGGGAGAAGQPRISPGPDAHLDSMYAMSDHRLT